METFLNTFIANGKFFEHYIDTVTDETFIVDEEEGPSGKRLFVVSNDGVVTKDDEAIGKFITGPNCRWGFIDGNTGKQTWTQHTSAEAEGLLNAERVIFAQMLEHA